jgi:Flp pilus assembly protein TadG
MLRRNLQREDLTRHGAAATELAIMLPFLLLLFGVILDFGRVYFVSQTLDNSVNAAALFACGAAWTPSGSTDSITLAKAAACSEACSLSPPLDSSNVAVMQNGNVFTVVVTYDCPLLTPILNPSRQIRMTRTLVVNRLPIAGE